MQKSGSVGKWTLGLLLSLSILSFAGLGTLQAQEFPTKPIDIVQPLGAGGQNDLIMRLLSPLAPQYFGQPWVVKLRVGGGGAVGSNEVAQATPDGHTLLCAHANSNTVLPAAQGRSKGPADLDAVVRLTTTASAFYVRSDAPWKNFKEVIAWAKAHPGQLTFGNAGTWSSNDFTWRWIEHKTGIKSRNVPHDGGAQCTIALLGNHIHISRLSPGHAYPQWKAGKIRPIVVQGDKRIPDMPDVPSMLEEGYDMEGLGIVWTGILAPKGTPKPVIHKLADSFKRMLQDPKAVAGIKNMGTDWDYLGPDEFAKVWKSEYNGYAELVRLFKK